MSNEKANLAKQIEDAFDSSDDDSEEESADDDDDEEEDDEVSSLQSPSVHNIAS